MIKVEFQLRFLFILFQLICLCAAITKTHEDIAPIGRTAAQTLSRSEFSRSMVVSTITTSTISTRFNNGNYIQSTTAGSESLTNQTSVFVIPGRELIITPVG